MAIQCMDNSKLESSVDIDFKSAGKTEQSLLIRPESQIYQRDFSTPLEIS